MFDIDLNRLGIFNSVVLAGSFSKAALILKQPKSRVSRQIASLEAELGVQLIYRTTRQFELTPAGRELFQEVSPVLADLNGRLEQVRSIADEVKGPVKISVPEDIGVELMGRLCKEFMELHPKVQIDLHVGNQKVDLVKDSFDIALRIGKVDDSTMMQRKIGRVDLQLVMSPSCRSRFNLHRLEDLEKVPFLAFSAVHPRNIPILVRRKREERRLNLSQVFSTNNFFVLRDMAIAGAGLTCLPPFLLESAIASGDLQVVFRDWSTDGSPIQILTPQQKEMPLRIRTFSDFLSEKLSPYF